ncbi:GerMN domain-containing protein [Raineyella fluvialis]|uniref:GerMN domain-containing protein n=1 Tax=Raineyella fluvialis TaxID=2662261 RepID=A0A5Q2F9G2_9ACTN|nr:GerMN domain-containing protein [Raineyella fluvialis]QGF23449.1 hypothetical protein Rai3103_06955 [Raineyella fluvialis]
MRKLIGIVAALGLVLVVGACSLMPTAGPTPQPISPATPRTNASTSPSGSVTSSTPAATMTVTLYYGNQLLNPGSTDCAQVYAVHRTVPASGDVLTATMRELVVGPTIAETAQGYVSFFSPATSQSLISAKVVGNTSYLNFTDFRPIIPNASTSCGSAALLAQLRTTGQQAGMTPGCCTRSTVSRGPSGSGSRWAATRPTTTATRRRSAADPTHPPSGPGRVAVPDHPAQAPSFHSAAGRRRPASEWKPGGCDGAVSS